MGGEGTGGGARIQAQQPRASLPLPCHPTESALTDTKGLSGSRRLPCSASSRSSSSRASCASVLGRTMGLVIQSSRSAPPPLGAAPPPPPPSSPSLPLSSAEEGSSHCSRSRPRRPSLPPPPSSLLPPPPPSHESSRRLCLAFFSWQACSGGGRRESPSHTRGAAAEQRRGRWRRVQERAPRRPTTAPIPLGRPGVPCACASSSPSCRGGEGAPPRPCPPA